MTLEHDLSWRVERVCAAAWPNLKEEIYGDWVFRFGGGLTKRANSVNPYQIPHGDITTMLHAAERAYTQENLPLRIRVPSMLDASIEQQLARQGFISGDETLTLHMDLLHGAMRQDPDIIMHQQPDRLWLKTMWNLKGYHAQNQQIHAAILGKITAPAAFMALVMTGHIVALGYVVIDDNHLCLESLITDPEHRQRGYAQRLLGAMLAWGISQGVEGACLQVTAANEPARRLYRSMGFIRTLYHYRYWRMAN